MVQAGVAGLAVVALFLAAAGDAGGGAADLVATVLVGSLGLHLAIVVIGEVGVTHATRDAQRAARALRKGALRSWFLAATGTGALALVTLVAALVGSAEGAHVARLVAGALLALASLWIWEHAWLRAGQIVPLS